MLGLGHRLIEFSGRFYPFVVDSRIVPLCSRHPSTAALRRAPLLHNGQPVDGPHHWLDAALNRELECIYFLVRLASAEDRVGGSLVESGIGREVFDFQFAFARHAGNSRFLFNGE